MLRPSAFQNNGNSSGINSNNSNSGTESSSSKSILRPSSFQLAAANSAQTTNKSDDEPTTTSSTTVVSSDEKASSSSSQVAVAGAEDDGKISSTTSNNNNNSSSSSTSSNSNEDENLEPKMKNPFNNSKVKNATDDDDDGSSDTEAKAKAKAKANDAKPNDATASANNESGGAVATAVAVVVAAAKSPTLPTTPLLTGQNLFAPNASNLFAAAASKAPSTSSIRNGSENNIGFVFGQNIHERIIGAPDTSTSSNADDTKGDSCSGGELFAAAAANSATSSSAHASSSNASTINGSESKETSRVEDLTKAAREYEESRAQKRKYDEVETFTGEENEVNVLDVNCKLFAFVASNWEERGPGSLRLNDLKDASEVRNSRVVFRTSGNLRVVLNTKVWKGMVVEKSSQKSLRLTAIDSKDGQIKIFLAMARPDDISSLYTALKKRIELEKEKADTSGESSTSLHGDGDISGDGLGHPSGVVDEPSNKKDKQE